MVLMVAKLIRDGIDRNWLLRQKQAQMSPREVVSKK